MSSIKSIYAAAKVLINSCLWHESWGRVAAEAVMNGIAELSFKSGGFPDAVVEDGICLDAPAECQKDWIRMPTKDEMCPWFEALKRFPAEDRTVPVSRQQNSTISMSVLTGYGISETVV